MRQSDTQRMPEVYTDFRRTAVEAWSMRNTYTAAECAAHAPGDDPAGEQCCAALTVCLPRFGRPMHHKHK